MPGLIRGRRKLPPQVSDDPYSLRWGPDSYLDHRPDFKNVGRYWVPSETPFWVPHERSFLRRAIEQAQASSGMVMRAALLGRHDQDLLGG
jgi:hypothetical protein